MQGFLFKYSGGAKHEEKLDKLSQIEELVSIDNAFALCLKLSEEVSEVKEEALKILISKEDQEAYDQLYLKHFPEEFWAFQRQVFPPEMPNFISVFNFQTPQDLSQGVSITDLENFISKIQEALIQDFDLLTQDKTPQEIEALKEKYPTLFAKNEPLNEMLKELITFQQEKERTDEEFSHALNFVKTFYERKDLNNAYLHLSNLKKKFPTRSQENTSVSEIEEKIQKAFALQSQIYSASGEKRTSLLDELKEIMGEYTPKFEEKITLGELNDKEKEITNNVTKLIEQKNWGEAYQAAFELSAYAPINSYLLKVEIKTAQNKALGITEEVNEIVDKSTTERIKFWEAGILIAEETIKAAEELKIPVDDSEYWQKPEKRVDLLKQMGKYEMYKTVNKSDPNLPPKVDPSSGMYFRWFDGRGVNMTENQGDSGNRYLHKAKQSDARIWALSGAFSFNWTPDERCYTPREFIEKSKTLISQVGK